MSDRRGKKRPKSYYRKSSHSKRQKLNTLSPGMRGFLITCNYNEKQAVRESYNILNEYADELYGAEQLQSKKADSDGSGSEEEEEEDMEKAMAKEVQAIKEQQAERRFQNTETSAKNCIFIRTTLENPVELHHKIFSNLLETKVSKARFALRMLPVAGSCKAVLADIKSLAEEILPKYFSTKAGEERTFSVIFKTRNNSGVSRDSVLPMLGEFVKGLNPLNKVHCDNPDVAIIVEIICSVCCLGVCTDFYKFRKCNLHEVVKDSSKPDAETTPEVKGETEQTSKTEAEVEVKDSSKPDAEPKPEVEGQTEQMSKTEAEVEEKKVDTEDGAGEGKEKSCEDDSKVEETKRELEPSKDDAVNTGKSLKTDVPSVEVTEESSKCEANGDSKADL